MISAASLLVVALVPAMLPSAATHAASPRPPASDAPAHAGIDVSPPLEPAAAEAAPVGAIPERVLTKHIIDDPLAVCNDGTRAVYYFDPPTSPSRASKFIVHLQGGGWCYSDATCAARGSWLKTSDGTQPTRAVVAGSLLNMDDGPLAGAGAMYVHYCSSDAYVGNTDTSPTAGTSGRLLFRGQRIVMGAIDALGARHGLASGMRATVIVSGCSAGARGVMHNLNRIGARVAGVAPDARVVGLLDSALYLDLPVVPTPVLAAPAATPRLSVVDQARAVLDYTHASIDPACADAYAGAEHKCLVGEYALRTLTPAHLVFAFGDDAYQLSEVLLPPHPAGIALPDLVANATWRRGHADWVAAVRSFEARLRQVLERTQPSVAYHSPKCWSHCNTETREFSRAFRVGGVSLADALAAYAFGATAPRLLEVCDGFACGADCVTVTLSLSLRL